MKIVTTYMVGPNLHYVKCTLDHGLSITPSAPTSLTSYIDVIGQDARTLVGPLLVIVCTWVIIWFLGLQKGK